MYLNKSKTMVSETGNDEMFIPKVSINHYP